MTEEHYLGNPLLKKANTKLEFTEDQVLEWMKCAEDPVYFAKNYIKIVTLDHGLQPFEMYPFQERMVRAFDEHRFVIGKLARQSGKCFHKDTTIRLRHKKTNEIIEMTVEDYYEKIKKGSNTSMP